MKLTTNIERDYAKLDAFLANHTIRRVVFRGLGEEVDFETDEELRARMQEERKHWFKKRPGVR